jgi:hypothetical protein
MTQTCITWTPICNNEEVKDTEFMCLHAQPKTFFADGTRKLVDQNNKYVAKIRVYNEK